MQSIAQMHAKFAGLCAKFSEHKSKVESMDKQLLGAESGLHHPDRRTEEEHRSDFRRNAATVALERRHG